jgi:hypothetical protein
LAPSLPARTGGGRLADLRHADLQIHPYPPTGYAYNQVALGIKDDPINIAEANIVKADLLADGKVDLSAFSTGDGSALWDGVTGALTKARPPAISASIASSDGNF